MAALFDMDVVTLLQDVWREAALDEAAFRELVPGGASEQRVAAWRDSLVPRGDVRHVAFGTSFNLGDNDGPPMVIVTLEEGAVQADGLGHVVDDLNDEGQEYRVMVLRQTAQISVFAGNAEELRALHAIVRRIMLREADWFLEAGYLGVEYEGGGDLSMEEQLSAEMGGVFVRTQRWSTMALDQVRRARSATRKPWLVAEVGAEVDGLGGGANPHFTSQENDDA